MAGGPPLGQGHRLDTASIDYGQSKDFKAHIILAEQGIPIFENVARIGELPPKGFTIVASHEDQGRQRRPASHPGPTRS